MEGRGRHRRLSPFVQPRSLPRAPWSVNVTTPFHSDSGGEAQRTVVTVTRGPFAGQRVVRGREQECLSIYERVPGPQPSGMNLGPRCKLVTA